MCLREGDEGNIKFTYSFYIKKYRNDNFNLYIVEYVESNNKDKLLSREQYNLDELKSYYNVLDKTRFNLGNTYTEEIKQFSDFKKDLYRKNNSNNNKTHTKN